MYERTDDSANSAEGEKGERSRLSRGKTILLQEATSDGPAAKMFHPTKGHNDASLHGWWCGGFGVFDFLAGNAERVGAIQQ
jgi:hypothetical protein